MEKVSEFFIAIFTAFISLGAWVCKKMFSRIEKLESKVENLEINILRKEDLEEIKATQNLILQHLLEGKNK